jgi:membrane protease YdiL (CAAX protease family)
MRASARDFWLRVVCAVAATLVLAPVAGVLLPEIRFHRVMTRVLLGSLIVALLVRRRPVREWPAALQSMGLRGPDRGARLLAGVAVALALLALLIGVTWALGGLERPTAPHPRSILFHVGGALLTAIVVAFFEEVLCRGYMKDALGSVVSAFAFAAVHFFRPLHGSAPAGDGGYEPLLAVRRLPDIVESWTDPRLATLGLLSLFFLGLGLNRLRERTGSLYIGIGFHAGLVLGLKVYGRFLAVPAETNPWLFGGPRLHDGVLGTLMLALFLAAAWFLPLSSRLSRKRDG